MAGSITDMNRDSLASVSSSQDVHICCMTSSIDPVLLPIAIQLEYIFEKILECSSASENVSPLDIFLRQSFILESRTGLFTRACARSRPRSVSSPLESAKNMQFAKRLDAIDMERAVFIRSLFPKRVLKNIKRTSATKSMTAIMISRYLLMYSLSFMSTAAVPVSSLPSSAYICENTGKTLAIITTITAIITAESTRG